MFATSTVTGDRRSGTVAIAWENLTLTYSYRRGTGRARHDLTVWPAGTVLASSPRLADAMSEIAAQSAEAGNGTRYWRLDDSGDHLAIVAVGAAA